MSVILTAFAASGFWTVGDLPRPHLYAFRYPSMESCERDRPRVEADMAAHGQVVTLSQCKPVAERGA